jgi:hypothetical protein
VGGSGFGQGVPGGGGGRRWWGKGRRRTLAAGRSSGDSKRQKEGRQRRVGSAPVLVRWGALLL